MTKLVNRAKMTTATTGTGTITLGSAVDGYQTFANAGVANADIVRYVIEDGDAWEIGLGTYTSSGTTLTRGSIESSNADAALNLSGDAVVFVTAAAGDIQQPPAEGAFADGDKTKLDGIEALADVTDTANVTAAGALMDSEVTNLDQVKTFDSADYATAAQGDLADSAIQPGDNISALTNDAGYTTNVGDITGVTAGAGIAGGGTSGTVTISHADTSAQGSVNNSGRTFIQDITLDTYGHVTGIVSATDADTFTGTVTSVATGGGLTGGTITTSGTISHADTSSQASVNNSGNTVIQDVTLDTYGHVTSLGSLALTLGSFGVTATTAELNKLDGFTGTVADLNYAKDLRATGVTTTEFDKLDGLTATTAELNILDGVTASTAELNVLDGIAGIASQAEAEAGTDNTKLMTPLRVAEAIDAAPTPAPTTAQVLSATADASAGAVGTYALLGSNNDGHTSTFGQTRAGSQLFPAGFSAGLGFAFNGFRGAADPSAQNSARAGTWMCMGVMRSRPQDVIIGTQRAFGATLWLRIS